MKIFVRSPTGRTICLRVRPSDTLDTIKAKIQEQQCLVFDGVELDGTKTLADYDIEHRSTLDLQERMQINVRATQGGDTILTLQVDSQDTIDSVKARIQDLEGFSKGLQCLIFENKELRDSSTLADHGVSMDSTLLLVLHPYPAGGMEIFVKMMTGKTATFGVERSDSVHSLKVRIYLREGIPPAQQRLIYVGKQLQNGDTLADYDVQKHSTIHMVLCLCGC